MFIMDIPNVPPQQAPIVLVQAATSGDGSIALQPDFILNACKETVSIGNPRSAMRAVSPAAMLRNYLSNREDRAIELSAIKNITLLESPKNGELISEVSNNGLVGYRYDAEPEYVGEDRAVFMAVFEGKRYKIVVELKVSIAWDEDFPECPEPQLIKVNGKPVSGSLDFGLGYSVDSLSVTFADLAGGAVGQAVGNTITLDDNAAGHNWYIDTTPWDNSEYLPTSNPYEWVAKEGSAAYGKMDMLSVLLHEYGHALGIDHSADKDVR